MSEVRKAAEAARDAAQHVATLTTDKKNDYLRDLATALVAAEDDILRANASDIARAEEDGLSTPKLKRLGITAESLAQMAEGLRVVMIERQLVFGGACGRRISLDEFIGIVLGPITVR